MTGNKESTNHGLSHNNNIVLDVRSRNRKTFQFFFAPIIYYYIWLIRTAIVTMGVSYVATNVACLHLKQFKSVNKLTILGVQIYNIAIFFYLCSPYSFRV